MKTRGIPAYVAVANVNGFLGMHEAALLYESARRFRPGAMVVEIGSYQGKSTILLAKGLQAGEGGTDSMVQQFTAGRFVVGVDRYLPSLERNREVSSYAALVNGDIMDPPFASRSVDAVVALDVIEHFGKADGLRLLGAMERTARRQDIVYTPNGFVPQAASDNPWQEHLSGWTVEEFRARGYAVYGIYGRKDLRGEYARLIRRPRLWWELVSAVSQIRVWSQPAEAFALLAGGGERERETARRDLHATELSVRRDHEPVPGRHETERVLSTAESGDPGELCTREDRGARKCRSPRPFRPRRVHGSSGSFRAGCIERELRTSSVGARGLRKWREACILDERSGDGLCRRRRASICCFDGPHGGPKGWRL
jgi:hypothetical protein